MSLPKPYFENDRATLYHGEDCPPNYVPGTSRAPVRGGVFTKKAIEKTLEQTQ